MTALIVSVGLVLGEVSGGMAHMPVPTGTVRRRIESGSPETIWQCWLDLPLLPRSLDYHPIVAGSRQCPAGADVLSPQLAFTSSGNVDMTCISSRPKHGRMQERRKSTRTILLVLKSAQLLAVVAAESLKGHMECSCSTYCQRA